MERVKRERSKPPGDAPEGIPSAASEPQPATAPGESTSVPPSPPSPRKYRRRLSSLQNVKAALADALRRLEGDEIGEKKARSLFYGLSVLAGVIADEKKLDEFEEKLGQLKEQVAIFEGLLRTSGRLS